MRPLLPLPRGSIGIAGRVSLPLPGAFRATPAASAAASAPAAIGYPPAPVGAAMPLLLGDAASAYWVRQVADAANNILRGKLNATATVTLAASAATTTIIDVRISAFSALLFSPLTADAAAEMAVGTFFVQSQTSGSAILAHANNAQTDRTFRLLIIG